MQRPRTRVTSWAAKPKGAITNASKTDELPVVAQGDDMFSEKDIDGEGDDPSSEKLWRGDLVKETAPRWASGSGNSLPNSGNGDFLQTDPFFFRGESAGSIGSRVHTRQGFRRNLPPLQLDSVIDGTADHQFGSAQSAGATPAPQGLHMGGTQSSTARSMEYTFAVENEIRRQFRGLEEKMEFISSQVSACLDGMSRGTSRQAQLRRQMRSRRMNSPARGLGHGSRRELVREHGYRDIHRPESMSSLRSGTGSGPIKFAAEFGHEVSTSTVRDTSSAFTAQAYPSTYTLERGGSNPSHRRVSFSTLSPRTAEGASAAASDFARAIFYASGRGSLQGSDTNASCSDENLAVSETPMARDESADTVGRKVVGTPWAGLRSLLSGSQLDQDQPDMTHQRTKMADKGYFFNTLSHKPSDLPANRDSSPLAFQATRRIRSSEMKDRMARMSKADAFLSLRQQRSQFSEQVWAIIDDPESSLTAWTYSVFLRAMVLASVVLSLLQTFRSPFLEDLPASITEMTFDIFFFLDICSRFWSCPSRYRFFFDFYNLVDLVSVSALPLRVYKLVGQVERDSVTYYILFCIVPVFRLLKSLRGFQTFKLLLSAFRRAFEALPVLLFTLLTIVMTFSALIYVVEPRENIDSLPDAMYFVIVSITTVGYGDVRPWSPEGRTLVCILVIIGVLYMAMPIGIIGSAFNEVWSQRDKILLMLRVRDRMDLWGYKPRDIPVLFNLFDKNTDGELSWEDFRFMIKEMRLGLSEERIVQLFQSFDVDSSGTIDAAEFIRHLFPSAYHTLFEVSSSGTGGSNYASLQESGSRSTFRFGDILRRNGPSMSFGNEPEHVANPSITVQMGAGAEEAVFLDPTQANEGALTSGGSGLMTTCVSVDTEEAYQQSNLSQRQKAALQAVQGGSMLQVPPGLSMGHAGSGQGSLRSARSGMSPVNEVPSARTSVNGTTTNGTSSRGGASSGMVQSQGDDGAVSASTMSQVKSTPDAATASSQPGIFNMDDLRTENGEAPFEPRPSTPDSGGASTSIPMLPLELESRKAPPTSPKPSMQQGWRGFSCEL